MQSAVLAMVDSVWPSDRLSDTCGYHAKTTPATIMRYSLEDSPMTLVIGTSAQLADIPKVKLWRVYSF